MNKLVTWFFRHIRYVVLLTSIGLSGVLYFWVSATFSEGTVHIIKLTQWYALLAFAYLYAALLASPLTQIFPKLPGRGHYLRARRAIGVSAFYFAALHASLAFWGQLGGFAGLPFLPTRYLVAISLSFTALIILSLMAATSFNRMVAKLGYRRWKQLHRLVYVAGVFILIHALMLGTHFSSLHQAIPQIFLGAVGILLFLEAIRFDRYVSVRNKSEPQFFTTYITAIVLISLLLYSLLAHHPLGWFDSHGHGSRGAGLVKMASAHVLQTDETIGAVLHVSPDHEPVAQEPSTLLFGKRYTE